MSRPPSHRRIDELDPLPYETEWPDLRCVTGRIDVHSPWPASCSLARAGTTWNSVSAPAVPPWPR